MNFIKKWILTKLGYLCPKCGARLIHRSDTFHDKNTYGYVICKRHKWFNSGTCDYHVSFKL